MKNTASSKTDQLLEGSECGFSLSLSPHPSWVQAENRVRSRSPVKCLTWTVSVSVYSHTVSNVSSWFGFCVVFNWSQNCARTEGLPQPPLRTSCRLSTTHVPGWSCTENQKRHEEEEEQSSNSILNVIFCLEGNFLILVATTSVWWLPGQNQNLRVKPLWTNNLRPRFYRKPTNLQCPCYLAAHYLTSRYQNRAK